MNNRGLLHKVMLAVILLCGFGLALALPQYKKYQDVRHARHAVLTLKDLAAAEAAYFEKNGFYTADFALLPLRDSCSFDKGNGAAASCGGYDFSLPEANVLRAASRKYPQWFELSLSGGGAECKFDAGSAVGARLCAEVNSSF